MNFLAFSHPLQQWPWKVLPHRGGAFLLIAAISIFGLCAALRNPAQSPTLIPGPLDGHWTNIASETVNLARIEIHGTEIHLFGDCRPTPCDWGVEEARGYASSVRSSDITALYFHRVTNFNEVEIAISLERDGLLRVQTFTHFTDSSRRADYSMVDFFERDRAPNKP